MKDDLELAAVDFMNQLGEGFGPECYEVMLEAMLGHIRGQIVDYHELTVEDPDCQVVVDALIEAEQQLKLAYKNISL